MTLNLLEQQTASPISLPQRGAQPGEARVLDPHGNIAYIPEENLEAALEAGAKLLTPDKMRELRQEVFMQHLAFKDEHAPPEKRKRRSIVKSNRTHGRRW
jgi:hypothetical protein